MIELIYVDDVLLFGTEQDSIDKFVKELQYDCLSFNIEEDVYDFLGFEFKTEKHSGKVTLNQGGSTKKVLKEVGMLDSNNKITPVETMILGKDADGTPFDKTWDYASVVGF